MRLKADENVHPDAADFLAAAGHDVATVWGQGMRGRGDESVAEVCRAEGRALLTFDRDFANILAYPPERYHGLIVLRFRRQNRAYTLALLRRFLPELNSRDVDGQLLILEETGIRRHGEPPTGDAAEEAKA